MSGFALVELVVANFDGLVHIVHPTLESLLVWVVVVVATVSEVTHLTIDD